MRREWRADQKHTFSAIRPCPLSSKESASLIAQLLVARGICTAEAATEFRQKTMDLVDLLNGKTFKHGKYKGSVVYPDEGELPEVWILGGGGKGLDLAIELKKNYSHGLFLKPRPESETEQKNVIDKL